jgi:hypothetical protein
MNAVIIMAISEDMNVVRIDMNVMKIEEMIMTVGDMSGMMMTNDTIADRL